MPADVTHFRSTRGLPKRMANSFMSYTTTETEQPNMSVSPTQRHAFLQYYLFQKTTGQMGIETYVNKIDLMIS